LREILPIGIGDTNLRRKISTEPEAEDVSHFLGSYRKELWELSPGTLSNSTIGTRIYFEFWRLYFTPHKSPPAQEVVLSRRKNNFVRGCGFQR